MLRFTASRYLTDHNLPRAKSPLSVRNLIYHAATMYIINILNMLLIGLERETMYFMLYLRTFKEFRSKALNLIKKLSFNFSCRLSSLSVIIWFVLVSLSVAPPPRRNPDLSEVFSDDGDVSGDPGGKGIDTIDKN